ncbi:MAG: C69 family dipeptidase [Thermodesulfobacteriota bacterium]
MCDTFVALPPVTGDGAVIFGKNSDREPNEAQVLEFHPQREENPAVVRCTYVEIPQVRRTNAVLLSRPFWMWGAEMGANEKGVVIGNEAVFTRMPYDRKGGLTGMDLLRLALERSETAEEALETIVRLLSDHGQGGVCGYEDTRMVYHNSFIIADPEGAWVLETSGHLWAALEIRELHAISNGLTIGEAFDRSHPELIETARRKKWLQKGATFHFADCYSDRLYTTFSDCRGRRSRALSVLGARKTSKIGIADALSLLRDHAGDDYRPDGHWLTSRICVHAGNGLTRNSGTTGSFAARLLPDRQTYWATGTAAPCTAIFKPIRFSGAVLPDLGPPPGGYYDEKTLWWRHEAFHRRVLCDLSARGRLFAADRDRFEQELMAEANQPATESFSDLTRKAFEQADRLTAEWMSLVVGQPIRRPNGFAFRSYWRKQNRKAGLPLECSND